MATHGSPEAANSIMLAVMAGEDLEIPVIDWDSSDFQIPTWNGTDAGKQVTRLTNNDLTERKVGGNGTFDALMDGFKAHLKDEYNQGRITGAEYTKAYIALTQSAMQNAVQYLLGRDTSFWQSVNAQAAAVTARVNLAMAKVQYVATVFDAQTKRAAYALTKLKLATEDMQYATLAYQVEYTLPAQLILLREQTEAQRAQTLNTRTDGLTVEGVMGMQTALYSQQITSYVRDAEVKAGKLLADMWSTRYAVVEPDTHPMALEKDNMDSMLKTIQENNQLPFIETVPGVTP